MPESIISTQIVNVTIVPLSFISVSIHCEFAMLPDVYILLILKKKRCTLLPEWGQIYTSGSTFIKKKLNPLSVIILVCLGKT